MPDRDLRGRLRRANPVRLAVLGVALSVGVFAGIQLGNSAIADINPIHYRGAVLHPRERGAAVPEQRVRPAEPRYAALYGWDEGRAALAAERDGFGDLETSPPPIAAAPRRRAAAAQAWNQPTEPRRFRASVSDNEVRVHRYDYQSRDTYLPPSGGAEDRSEDKPETRD